MKKHLSAVLVAGMLLAGCSTGSGNSEPAKFKAGTYTGTGKGNNGAVVVEVEFTDQAIKNVTIKEHSETPGLSDPAIEKIPFEILDAQSTAVDTVSGATNTSKAIIEAVNDCIVQAGGTVEESTATTEGEKKEEAVDTDVLVIGGGMAGMAAALAASDAGADVTIVEKAATLGGTVNVAGGYLIACNSEMFKDTGSPDTLEDFKSAWSDHMAYSGQSSGYPDEERLDLVLAETGSTVDWLATKGAEWAEEPFVYFDGGTYTCAVDVDNGPGLVAQLSKTISDEGIHVVLETTGVSLTTDESGAVIGAVAESKDSIITYSAKAVILCTGGYANNEEMLAEYAPKLAKVHTVSGAIATATGEGFTMAMEVGADMFEAGTGFGSLWATNVEPSALALDADLAGVSFAKAMGVDASGKRFANEAPNVAYMDATASDMIQNGNGPFWYVFDSSDADTAALLEKGAEAGAVKKADTIENLAKEIGVDGEALKASYETYNEACASGTDSEFDKKAENLVALDNGTLYALQFVPTTFGSTGGVKTDEAQHVLKADGSVIKGLYAAGEMSNRYFYNENYMLGGSLGLYATCGRTAGTNAAEGK